MTILTDDIRKAIHTQLTAYPQTPLREHVQVRNAGAWVKAHHSDALGVDPADVPRAMAHLRAHGVAADFDNAGRCIVTSDKQFQDISRASGLRTGRDGYNVRDYEGNQILSGRQPATKRAELRRAVDRGDFDT